MKTLGQVFQEIDLDRKRERMERVKSVIPYLQNAYSSLKQQETQTEQRNFALKQQEETRKYEADQFNNRKTEQRNFANKQEAEQRKYNEEQKVIDNARDLANYQAKLNMKDSSKEDQGSGLSWFSTIKPKDYVKEAGIKVQSEEYEATDGTKKQGNYVIIRKSGKLTQLPVNNDKGVYRWKDGTPVDLSKTIPAEEYAKAIQAGDIGEKDGFVNPDDIRAKRKPQKVIAPAKKVADTLGNADITVKQKVEEPKKETKITPPSPEPIKKKKKTDTAKLDITINPKDLKYIRK